MKRCSDVSCKSQSVCLFVVSDVFRECWLKPVIAKALFEVVSCCCDAGNFLSVLWMQHTDDNQPDARSHIVLTSNHALFFSPVFCLASRLLFRWGGLTWLTPCVALRCHGNNIYPPIPPAYFSVLLCLVAPDPPSLCVPLVSLSPLSFLTLAVTALRPRSVLVSQTTRWPTPGGRRCWRELCGPRCYSQQGTVLY